MWRTRKQGEVTRAWSACLAAHVCAACLQLAGGKNFGVPGGGLRASSCGAAWTPRRARTISTASPISASSSAVEAVLVTDAGGSLADGRWLRAIIREKTRKPIKYVVLSHVHPDHALGAAAFLADAPAFVGHARLGPALAARGEFYRKRLVEILGEPNVGPVVTPTRIVAERDEIDLGGRVVRFRAHGPAHTTSDLSMLDQESGLFLPADLLFVGRCPSLDGSLAGWIAELGALQAEGFGKATPGHGPLTVDFRDRRRRSVEIFARAARRRPGRDRAQRLDRKGHRNGRPPGTRRLEAV